MAEVVVENMWRACGEGECRYEVRIGLTTGSRGAYKYDL